MVKSLFKSHHQTIKDYDLYIHSSTRYFQPIKSEVIPCTPIGEVINHCGNYVSMKESADEVLSILIRCPHESEVVEFKDRKTIDKDEMGRYFSALSNEANLKGLESAWIVFGLTDKGVVVNSNYLDTQESQNKLKKIHL